MTNDELEEIRARAEAATAGPWDINAARASDDTLMVCAGEGHGYGLVADVLTEPDAAFIAHARTDIPALLDEVARVRNPGGDQLRTLTIAELSGDLNIMLFNEQTGLWDRCRVDDFRAEAAKEANDRATRAEAHAERVASLMGEMFEDGPVTVGFAGNPVAIADLERRARQALYDYNQRTET